MKNWYKELADRFATFPAHVQILNMVSDLKKAENLLQVNRQSALNHLFRAIILLDYIVDDPKWKRKLKELLRLREVIGSIIFSDKPLGDLSQTITAALLLEPTAYRSINLQSAISN
jgi:hypothetical protein